MDKVFHIQDDLYHKSIVKKNIFSKKSIPKKVRFDPTSQKVVYEVLGEKHKIIAIDIVNNKHWEDFFTEPVTLNDIAIDPLNMEVAMAVNKNIYITYGKSNSKKTAFESFEKIKSLQFSYDGKSIFIVTDHFLYDYDLSLKTVKQQWYFGIDSIENLFVHKSSANDKSLFSGIPIFLSNFNVIRDVVKMNGTDTNLFEEFYVAILSMLKHIKVYNTLFQNPPFTFRKILAQSPDGKMLVALDKGYAILLDTKNHKNPFFIDTHNYDNVYSATIGDKVFALANFANIYLYTKKNGYLIISLPEYYDHPVLSSNGDILSWLFAGNYKKSIDLNTNNIVDQTAFIPYLLSENNHFIMKKASSLAKERAKIKNDFQTLNKKLSISLQ